MCCEICRKALPVEEQAQQEFMLAFVPPEIEEEVIVVCGECEGRGQDRG